MRYPSTAGSPLDDDGRRVRAGNVHDNITPQKQGLSLADRRASFFFFTTLTDLRRARTFCRRRRAG
jgi:hypothetical protein